MFKGIGVIFYECWISVPMILLLSSTRTMCSGMFIVVSKLSSKEEEAVTLRCAYSRIVFRC